MHKPAEGCRLAVPKVIETRNDNSVCARPEFNLVAGTTWVFASHGDAGLPRSTYSSSTRPARCRWPTRSPPHARPTTCSWSATHSSCPQVTQASHPGNSGRSVLEHVLGDDTTMPADRGVFLSTTQTHAPRRVRLHLRTDLRRPAHSHPSCKRQNTVAGTGLRWIPAEHTDNTTSSPEEADLIVDEILRLIGTDWTDHKGNDETAQANRFRGGGPLQRSSSDYCGNDLEAHSETAGVDVGTVDKFQGQEAAVVFFSMTTSSGENVVHGKDFLFSRNRLNVAISRARCLAYLVCTEDLLNTRARTVDEMRLIATLNAFVECARHQRRRRAVTDID